MGLNPNKTLTINPNKTLGVTESTIAKVTASFLEDGVNSLTLNVTNSGSAAYIINGTNNPTLTLIRGFTYTFNVNASGHPFFIKTQPVTGTGSAYNDGVTNNGVAVGTITFTVTASTPSLLYYICQFHGAMQGVINIVDNAFPPQRVVADVNEVISPGSPVKANFEFTGWSPSLPRTISEDTIFSAQFVAATTTTAPPGQTSTPFTSVASQTATSVVYTIFNVDAAVVSIDWVIRLNTQDGAVVTSGTQTNVQPEESFNVSASGLSNGTTYWLTGVKATASGKTQSEEAIRRSTTTLTTTTTTQAQTATPQTAIQAVTETSVTFRIRNLDANIATIAWLIRAGTETGTIVASNTVNNVGFNADIFAQATGLSSNSTYWLTNVFATASGKTQSLEGIKRSVNTANTTTTTTTTQAPTAQPFYSNINTTTNSISFRANNADAANVSMTVNNNSTQTFLFSGNVAGTSFGTVSQSGLSAGTSYLFNITAQASGKTANNRTQNISTANTTTTTQAPPPPPPSCTAGYLNDYQCFGGDDLYRLYRYSNCNEQYLLWEANSSQCVVAPPPPPTTTTTAAPPPPTTRTATYFYQDSFWSSKSFASGTAPGEPNIGNPPEFGGWSPSVTNNYFSNQTFNWISLG